MPKLLSTIVAVLVIGVAWATPAHAITNETQTVEEIICEALDAEPTFSRVWGLARALVDQGLTYEEAGQWIGQSAVTTCPQHLPLLKRFVEVYG